MDVARSSSKVFLAEVVSAALSFLAITYFARELGAAKLGTFFLFQGVLYFLGRPADMGIRNAVQKRISEGSDPAADLGTAVVLKIGLLVVTVVALFAARGYVNDYIGLDLTGFLIVALTLREMASLTKNVLSGELRVGETATIDFAYNVVRFGLSIVLVYAGYGIVGLVLGVIAGLAVQFILAFHAMDTGFGYPSRARMYSLLGYAKFTVIPGIGYQVQQWLDVLILGFLATNDAVGAYEVAWRVGAPVLLAARSIGVAIFPQFSSWDSAGSTDDVERLFSRILTPSLFLVFPAFFGTMVLSREILGLVFDAEFSVAWLALIVIMAGKIPGGVRSLLGNALLGLNKPQYVTYTTVVTIFVNVVLNVVLIWRFGIVGAALATTIAITIDAVLRSYYLSSLIEIRVPYDELGWCVLASAVMGAVLFGVKTVLEIDTVTSLFGFVLTGVVLYFTFVLLYPPLKNQITAQIREIAPGSS